MEFAKEKLDALNRLTSTGSKLVVLAASTAVSSALVSWQLLTGQNPGEVDFFGQISLSGPLAVCALAVVSGATGWAAWAYLRQGQRQLYDLEFKNKLDPERIKNSLAGSSLASTSVLLLRALCVLAFFSIVIKLPNVATIQLIFGLLEGFGEGFMYLGGLLVVAPFLLITLMMPRLRYFNPSNWEMGTLFIRLLMKASPPIDSIPRLDLENMVLPEEAMSYDPTAFYEDLESLIPDMQAAGLHTLLRRFGRGIYLRMGQLDDLGREEMIRICIREADRILRRQLPHASPEIHTELRQQFIGF